MTFKLAPPSKSAPPKIARQRSSLLRPIPKSPMNDLTIIQQNPNPAHQYKAPNPNTPPIVQQNTTPTPPLMTSNINPSPSKQQTPSSAPQYKSPNSNPPPTTQQNTNPTPSYTNFNVTPSPTIQRDANQARQYKAPVAGLEPMAQRDANSASRYNSPYVKPNFARPAQEFILGSSSASARPNSSGPPTALPPISSLGLILNPEPRSEPPRNPLPQASNSSSAMLPLPIPRLRQSLPAAQPSGMLLPRDLPRAGSSNVLPMPNPSPPLSADRFFGTVVSSNIQQTGNPPRLPEKTNTPISQYRTQPANIPVSQHPLPPLNTSISQNPPPPPSQPSQPIHPTNLSPEPTQRQRPGPKRKTASQIIADSEIIYVSSTSPLAPRTKRARKSYPSKLKEEIVKWHLTHKFERYNARLRRNKWYNARASDTYEHFCGNLKEAGIPFSTMANWLVAHRADEILTAPTGGKRRRK